MAYRSYQLEHVGKIKITKRKSSRNIRLSVNSAGEVRVSMPYWASYSSGLDFVRSQKLWVKTQLNKQSELLLPGVRIGKAHVLLFTPSTSDAPKSRLVGNQIIVSYPNNLDIQDDMVQKKANEAAVRALRQQAEQLLPQRLAELSKKYSYPYQSVSIKNLKSRWGSCDKSGNITLNLFLMQLPWELIDYVLAHELVHTKILQHGRVFWEEMEQIRPKTSENRKMIKQYNTRVTVQP